MTVSRSGGVAPEYTALFTPVPVVAGVTVTGETVKVEHGAVQLIAAVRT